MNKSKITFGKIQLNAVKPAETNEEKEKEKDIGPEVPADIASTSGKRCLEIILFFIKILIIIVHCRIWNIWQK